MIPLVHGLIYNSAYKLKLADGKSPSMPQLLRPE